MHMHYASGLELWLFIYPIAMQEHKIREEQ